MATREKILIVDDEEGMREFLTYMLEGESFQVSTAASGLEALEKIRREEFALVLADVKMPGIDGLEMLRRVKEIDEQTVVIVMTAYASLDTAIKAIKFDAYDYLIKPFPDTDKVLRIIERGLARHRELTADEAS
ncbi:MAG: response regulator [Anaerolineae bacterium]|nr:MAG: response regulator [Anaerolineae bacterium]